MDYSKLHWHSDFMSHEIYGEDVEEFVVGIYSFRDFPQITVYINTETEQILEVYLDDEYYTE